MTGSPYEIWSVIGTWVSGIATTAAVVVSLYLARKADRVTLQVTVGIRLLLTKGSDAQPEFLIVIVTNASPRTVTVSGLAWSMGWANWGPVKKIHFYQTPSFRPDESQIPTAVAYGQVVRYIFPLSGERNWLTEFPSSKVFDGLGRWRRWFYLRTLKLHVTTTLGEDFSVHPERPLIDRLDSVLSQ